MHHMKTSPPPKNIRLTISVTPEVHATFERMASAGRMSMSRAMGDWLQDTVEAADFMAATLEKAKRMPSMATGELTGFAEAVTQQAQQILQSMAQGPGRGGNGAASAAQRAPARHSPPSGNTGGKGPKSTTSRPGGRS